MSSPESKIVEAHKPCPCGSSSDAYSTYDDGHGFCFSCGKYFNGNLTVEDRNVSYQYVPWRGISASTFKTFSVPTKVVGETPESVAAPFPNGHYNVKTYKGQVYTVGEKNGVDSRLFGKDQFPSGSAKAITITEGWLDALSVYQMLGSKYPVVSVWSASSAKNDCRKDFEYLNSFEKIYLCFDNDEPGRNALKDVAALFDFNKVYHVKLDQFKDANDYLQNGKDKEFISCWWNSKRFLPEGVISTWSEVDDILDKEEKKESIPYPFERLQSMTYGIRTGEVVLLTAQEGIGKTELLRAFEYNLLKKTDENIGIIHLEESKPRIFKGLAGYELKLPVHLPDCPVTRNEIKEAYRKATGRDERVHAYTHFGSDDPDIILSTIRFMASNCDCKRIFLDHITMVVTGLQDEDERRALDYISTALATMVHDLDFTLFLISHVNDNGQTRGSRNISKICDLRIDLRRDITNADPIERNTTYMTIAKNRFAGKTGPAGALVFDPETYTVSEKLELPE